MRAKIFLISSFLFFSEDIWATEIKRSNDNQKIFHALTLEADAGKARDGNAHTFDLDGWIGGNSDRLWLKAEKKSFGHYDKKSELQASYSKKIAQFWDAQIGARHDFSTDFSSQKVNYLTVGLQGLAAYSFETSLQLFLSDQRNYSARIKQKLDILITQKFITQPYFEAEFFAQNVPELEVKSGLSEFETGLLTRYEITRKFAPYVALRYNRKAFGTANLAKKEHERVDDFIYSAGLKLKF